MAISAKFEADFSQFQAAVSSADGSLKNLEGTSKTLGPAILASLASHQVRQFATDVKNVANEFIGAFAEEEAAVNKLGVALQAQGTQAYMAQYTALAEEFQRTTTNSDDLIVSMTALMVQVGGVMPDQMKGALEAAQNLSAGLGISLEAATMLVAKAFGQGGEQLGKLKALLGDSVKPGADMAEVMEAINSKFGGQAAAQLDTYTGKMANLNNQMGDFKEKVGELLVNALTPLMNVFAAMPTSLQTILLGAVALVAALAPLALSVGALTPLVTALATALGITMAGSLAALGALLAPGALILVGITGVYLAFKNWSAITGIAQAVYEGVKLWLVDKFQAIVEWVNQKIAAIIAAFRAMYMAVSGGSIVPDMVAGIASEFQKLNAVMVQPVIQATRLVTTEFAGVTGPILSPAAAGAGGAGGLTVNLYVNTPLGTPQAIADAVGAALLAQQRGQGARF